MGRLVHIRMRLLPVGSRLTQGMYTSAIASCKREVSVMRSDARYSVLVVEDDPNHSLLISSALAHGAPGAKVHLTERAEEAIRYLLGLKEASEPHPTALPDVIVLDMTMPGIGGIGFLQWLELQAEWARDIPVIVFTSSTDPELARRCFSLGAREFKEKPADFRELVELVGRVLQRWRP